MIKENYYFLKNWINENKKDILLVVLIFLIAFLSFGFGYLTNREFTHAPIIIQKCSNN